jgi:2-keto-4-pentenoate hydratase/2-oxohepta-3-ene-1,7-dioic acid hydratase in catechol pathway
MKLGQFKTKSSNKQRLGALLGDMVFDVAELARGIRMTGLDVPHWLPEASSTLELIQRGTGAVEQVAALVAGSERPPGRVAMVAYGIDEIEFLPAVNPSKILAIGRNYTDHALEGGAEPPKAPMIFNKLPSSLSAHNASIVMPTITDKVDYEAELAVVIGRRAKRVSEAEALDYVFGYTLMNDVTAREIQRGDGQWTRGKGLDTFAPLGPFITTRDEVADVHNLNIKGLLNGEVMQSSNTSRMIFNIPYLVSYISQDITLEPGDIISTGTPEGVGAFRKPPVWLKDGDVFEVTIEELGKLRNPVVAAK